MNFNDAWFNILTASLFIHDHDCDHDFDSDSLIYMCIYFYVNFGIKLM